jgi:gliding motility-associated-like protein
MKKFKNIEEFEDLLKDQLSGHSVPTPPDAWSSIASSTGSTTSILSQVTTYFSSVSNIIKVALFAGGITAAGIVLYVENTEEPSAESSNEISLVDDNSPTQEEATTTIEDLTESTPTVSENRDINTTPTTSGSGSSDLPAVNNGESVPGTPETNANNAEETVIGFDAEMAEVTNRITSSNTRPCVGDQVNLSTTQRLPGDWTINGKLVSKNATSIKHTCKEVGALTILFNSGTEKIAFNIDVISLETQIVETKIEEGVYQFKLQNEAIIANWYIDNKLVSSNTKSIVKSIETVGKHEVKATPINHGCTASIIYNCEIEPIGDIEWFTVFTPDGDGRNDEYLVLINNYDAYSIQIFNSSNTKVFASQNPKLGWNGQEFNTGKPCPSGEYVVKLSYKLKGEMPKQKNIKLALRR